MNRDDDADANDRDVLREALEALERAAKRFLAVIPTGAISHGDAVDLTADADELLDQLHRLTRAQRTGAEPETAR